MLRKFFNGRYGMDNLIITLLLLSAILLNMKYVWVLAVVFSGYAVFRMLSKNIDKRKLELEKFNKMTYKLRQYFTPLAMVIAKGLMSIYKMGVAYKTRFQQRKQYVFIKCTNCKNMLRLPRNKGKLSVTCPVCKLEFIKRT
jgi:LSD1 subclass zinc finger protein